MKKIVLFFGLLVGLICLGACSSPKPEAVWLEGDWRSEEWSVIYSFKESDGNWEISGGATPLTKQASLVEENGEWVLTDPDGTSFHIQKIDDRHIFFQQIAADGLLGTTASVEFVKVD